MPKRKSALRQWRDRMGISQREAAKRLGVALTTYQRQERERSFDTGKPIEVPLTTLLAAAALEQNPPLAPIPTVETPTEEESLSATIRFF